VKDKKVILIMSNDRNQREQMVCDIRNDSLNPNELYFYFARNPDDVRAILETVDIFIIVFLAQTGQANSNRFAVSSLRSLFRGEIICGATEKADRMALQGTECDLILEPDEVARTVLDFVEL